MSERSTSEMHSPVEQASVTGVSLLKATPVPPTTTPSIGHHVCWPACAANQQGAAMDPEQQQKALQCTGTDYLVKH